MKPTVRLFSAFSLALTLTATPAAAQPLSRLCSDGAAAPGDLLALDLQSLLNIKVITASKSSEALSDAPGMISVVTRDELQRFGGITLRTVLERVPGLTLSPGRASSGAPINASASRRSTVRRFAPRASTRRG